MSDPLYHKDVLRLAADAHGAGRLDNPQGTGYAHNPVCGDRVAVDLIVENGRVAAIALETKACVLTQASASILGRDLKGASREDVEALKRSLAAMLEAHGDAPSQPFEAYAVLDAAGAYPARHRCVLLPLEAVLSAFDASEARKPGGIRSER